MKPLLNVVAMTVVGLFAAIWLVICVRVFRFTPSPATPRLILSDNLVTTAGFLATTVATGTAAVLGVTIAQVQAATSSLVTTVETAFSESKLLSAGVLIYFFTGVITLIVWLANPGEAPGLFDSFALSLLGWAGGAFSCVFKAKSPSG